tara:strand:- start:603 stop:1232 length:630 start_codon:yes stop_codon:yes gene_type:complete
MSFGLVKHNNNSLSAVTSVGLTQGKMTLIKEQTASSSSSISFVDGSSSVVLDSSYPIYLFKFINIHPETNTTKLQINASTDSGSNYNVTKTTNYFQAYHTENDAGTALQYYANRDLAQSTSAQQLKDIGNTSDDSAAGTLHLFNPSSTTFVKHFISTFTGPTGESTQNLHNSFVGGYFNTTSAIDAVQFSMSSGNIDSGTIKLYGIKGS